MKRIIWHWTAGAGRASELDLEHYHYVINNDGAVSLGKWPVAANEKPVKGKYAAHTLNCNTGSIGIAVAAMAGAVERPFNYGKHPITPNQVDALVTLSRKLGAQYGIPVTPETMLSHAEVQPTLKIKQRGKWDIAWLPGMAVPGDPVSVGNKLRAMVKAQPTKAPAQAPSPPPVPPAPQKPATGLLAALLRALAALFRKGE
jgi:hypothetical protein